ncbi:MAG: helix-hairpin-helix domain-containing protein [Bacteroidetes bacterium]|nr:helix-hairpin-helix domain-containing protein [Bacteroidota bacterium]
MFKWLKDYFDVSNRERNGIIIMMVLIVLVAVFMFTFSFLFPDEKPDPNQYKDLVEKLKQKPQYDTLQTKPTGELELNTSAPVSLFYFNPNNATEEDFIKLGIKEKTAKTILNYRSKGIKGVGPSFASRILKLRKALGGFLNKEQLFEVWGMDTAKFEGIKNQVTINTSLVHYISLNKSSFDEMKTHPYIRWKMAKLITRYREAHYNKISSWDELNNIIGLDKMALAKAKGYLVLE